MERVNSVYYYRTRLIVFSDNPSKNSFVNDFLFLENFAQPRLINFSFSESSLSAKTHVIINPPRTDH
jgi:hypothetical protein